MLNWHDLDPLKVERAIEVLLRDMFPGLHSVDGSGGDGGRDAYLFDDGKIRVFEIKSYSRTLSGSQRRNIQRSLQVALIHQQTSEWILVIPHDHTPAEEEWFTQTLTRLAAPVTLNWWGRDWLDGQFASREDLTRYVEGPDGRLLHRAQQHGMEQAVLATATSASVVLNCCLELAVADELIKRNPAQSKIVKEPRRRFSKVVAWSDETVERIVEAHPERFRLLPTIGSAAGLRQGETFGLSVDDFDFSLMLIRVRRQVKRLGKEIVFALPKNDKERFVPMAPVLAKAVQSYIERFERLPSRCRGRGSTATSRSMSWSSAGRTVGTSRRVCMTNSYGSPRLQQLA